MVSCNLLADVSAQQQGGDWGDFCCLGLFLLVPWWFVLMHRVSFGCQLVGLFLVSEGRNLLL